MLQQDEKVAGQPRGDVDERLQPNITLPLVGLAQELGKQVGLEVVQGTLVPARLGCTFHMLSALGGNLSGRVRKLAPRIPLFVQQKTVQLLQERETTACEFTDYWVGVIGGPQTWGGAGPDRTLKMLPQRLEVRPFPPLVLLDDVRGLRRRKPRPFRGFLEALVEPRSHRF